MEIGELLNPAAYPTIPPVAPAPLTPTPNPADMVLRMQQYRDAFANMGNDPSINPAMVQLGAGLLQPVMPGQTPGGVAGHAISGAMNYYQALNQKETENLFRSTLLGQQERAAQSAEATAAEARAGAQQQRGITAAKAPSEVGTAQAAYQEAQYKLRLLAAEERSGTQDPTFLKRKGEAELAAKEALAKMYQAHATYYNQAGQAQSGKGKQTLNVKQNEDGSYTTTTMNNGELYFHTFVPPKFHDLRTATEAATKEVDKITPSSWNPLAGPVPYTGTREEEIARRAKEYMAPKLQILGRQGILSPQEYDQLSGPPPDAAPGTRPGPGSTPSTFPRETQQEAITAAERSLGMIRGELRDARKTGDQAAITALEKEESNAVTALKKGAPRHAVAAPASTSTQFTRDAQGNIVPEGLKVAPSAAAAAPKPASQGAARAAEVPPSEQAGQALEIARSALLQAKRTLLSYGVRQQRADPVGYRNALMAVTQKQNETSAAQQEYEKLVAPGLPAATGRVMP